MNRDVYQMLEISDEDGAYYEVVKEFLSRETTSGKIELSAESIYPTPSCFRIFAPDIVSTEEFVLDLQRRLEKHCGELPLTQEIATVLLKTHGAANRYDWRIEQWGTYSDFYHVSPWDDKNHRIRFCTAHTPSYPLYEKLSAKFWEVEFRISWRSGEGLGPAGRIKYVGGYRIQDDRFERDQAEYEEIDKLLWVGTEEDRLARSIAPF
jgi:hypothetical protein